MENNMRMIEINGVKLEVDMSQATKVEKYKVGDNIKVLRKQYSSGYEVLNGVIVQFINFNELPTIQIAVFKQDYSGSRIEFIDYNSKCENIEISPCSPHELQLEKTSVIDKFNNEIASKQSAVDELVAKRDWFIKYFAKYFQNSND